jgi:hypothetical protein
MATIAVPKRGNKLALRKSLRITRNYRCPPRTPATIETIKSTIIPITKIFLVEDFI